MPGILREEHKHYGIDCKNAIWATNEIKEFYNKCGVNALSDADFAIEMSDGLLLIEYKNAIISEAREHVSTNKEGKEYNPTDDTNFNKLVKKCYDSLHYFHLFGKEKPIHYICVLEYSKGNSTSRKVLRNRLKKQLPFRLQDSVGTGIKLIESVDVVNIDEWNNHAVYGQFPIKPMEKQET